MLPDASVISEFGVSPWLATGGLQSIPNLYAFTSGSEFAVTLELVSAPFT